MKKIGVFAGTFDPFTCGHLDIVKAASDLFDEVVVAILRNIGKQPIFSVEERQNLIADALLQEQMKNVRAEAFEGLLIDYVHSLGATHIIRGLRTPKDFEYEFPIEAVNRKMAPDIRTVYFMSTPEHSVISSTIVREVGHFGGSLTGLVPEINENFIAERLAKR